MALTQVPQGMLDPAIIPLGVGQTWSNVTASRSFGTTYTNTTGRPIYVYVAGSGGSANAVVLRINGNNAQLSCGGTTTFGYAVASVISTGDTYGVFAAAGSPSVSSWFELR